MPIIWCVTADLEIVFFDEILSPPNTPKKATKKPGFYDNVGGVAEMV